MLMLAFLAVEGGRWPYSVKNSSSRSVRTTRLRAGVEQVKQQTKSLGDQATKTSKQVNTGFKEMQQRAVPALEHSASNRVDRGNLRSRTQGRRLAQNLAGTASCSVPTASRW